MKDNILGGALTETSLLILLSLFEENHGYAIGQYIEKETDGRVVLGAGTLYGALKHLSDKEFIKESRVEDRRKNYIITPDGIEIVKNELKRMEHLIELINEALEEKNV